MPRWPYSGPRYHPGLPHGMTIRLPGGCPPAAPAQQLALMGPPTQQLASPRSQASSAMPLDRIADRLAPAPPVACTESLRVGGGAGCLFATAANALRRTATRRGWSLARPERRCPLPLAGSCVWRFPSLYCCICISPGRSCCCVLVCACACEPTLVTETRHT